MNLSMALSNYDVPAKIINRVGLAVIKIGGDFDFFSDNWNILGWRSRPGNMGVQNLNFTGFDNPSLKVLAKAYVAMQRAEKGIAATTASTYCYWLLKLDKVVGEKDASSITTEDFLAVESTHNHSSKIPRYSNLGSLQSFASWLRRSLGYRIIYSPSDGQNRLRYGRNGTESGRTEKLLPIEIIRDLFRLASHVDISTKDKFYINAFIINTALGGRINELACLPLECLVERDGRWVLKVYPEKGGTLIFRPFPQNLLPTIKEAIAFITRSTEEGRQIVKRLKGDLGIDWKRVRKSKEALDYFSRKFCSQWIDNHTLYTPRGVYYSTTGQFVDTEGLLQRFGSCKLAAHFLGVSILRFENLLRCQLAFGENVYLYENAQHKLVVLDITYPGWKPRVRANPNAVHFNKMEKMYQVSLSDKRHIRDVVAAVLDEALECQLTLKSFQFNLNTHLEDEYSRKILPLIRESGRVVLEPSDALFIVPKYFFCKKYQTRSNDFQTVSPHMFAFWLKVSGRGEDSLFERYNIIDPRTGRVAKFVWHDIRHWLHTLYKKGGLTDLQVNTILGRKDSWQGHVYDQTLALDRAEVLEDMIRSVRDGQAIGKIAETYNELILADREIADNYLQAAVRIISPMPHGGCAHNLALKPCPYNLSCLTVNEDGEPCSNLLLDINNDDQFSELMRIEKDVGAIVKYIVDAGGEGGEQYKHLTRVRNTAQTLQAKRRLARSKNKP